MHAHEVREVRRQLGLTQQALAHRLGVTLVTVARWEGATRQIPEPTARLLKTLRRRPPHPS